MRSAKKFVPYVAKMHHAMLNGNYEEIQSFLGSTRRAGAMCFTRCPSEPPRTEPGHTFATSSTQKIAALIAATRLVQSFA